MTIILSNLVSTIFKVSFLFIHIYVGDMIAKENIEKLDSDASTIDIG